jgi:hypothetical protein
MDDIKDIISNTYRQAQSIGACALFTGKEQTIEDLVRLFTSPQGIEFCMKHHFPSLSTFRLFKQYGVDKYGIYIDAGNVRLQNPERCVLIGRTTATVNCDTLRSHEIVLFDGAKAVINASGWTVCRVIAEQGCTTIRNISNNAIIL